MFNIQDPRYENSTLLNEALLEACENAIYGAGTYAFVSAEGINLLMKNQPFKKFITQGHYFLLMGMDEITNSRTLTEADQLCYLYPNLRVRAFLHHTVGSTFHPKFSWFRCEKGGVLVLGSGNLTVKGLRRNTEAFVIQQLNEEEIDAIENKWNDWIDSSKECIKSIDNPEVIQRAKENTQKVIKQARCIPCEDEYDAWVFDLNSEVFIAEIPIGLEREMKKGYLINFDRDTLKTFFCTDSEIKRPVLLRKVTNQGLMQDIETHSVILTPSNKYQIELVPDEKALYSNKGRPLAVFVKLSARTFLYMVIMPEESGYEQLEEELNNYRYDVNHIVKHQTNVEALRNYFSSLAILQYLN